MTVRIVQLGSPRLPDEGLRIGAVRRPPRGVPRERFAADDWYDVWLPQLAPSAELVKAAQRAASEAEWGHFVRRYRREMATGDNRRLIELLAALSRTADFSLGCYCQEEDRCHRSVLRELLAASGAELQEPLAEVSDDNVHDEIATGEPRGRESR